MSNPYIMDTSISIEERCAVLERENAAAAVAISEARERCALLEQQNAELTAKVKWFMEQFNLLKQKQYGASSEKTVPGQEQLSFFNEAESESRGPTEGGCERREPTVETITYKRRKERGQREEMLKDLPVETVEYNLSPEERVCPNCGETMHEMSVEVRQELKVIPAQVKLVKHVRHVYSCRRCEREGTSTPVVTAPAPAPVIPGSLASPSAVAHIMNQKYVEGLPLYRQEQQLSSLGIELSRQTMANWMVYTSDKWLAPLYDRMREHLLRRDILQADETTLQVLREDGREAESRSYMWMYRTGRDGPPIALFDYKTTRAGKHPKKFLSGFRGYLQVDGYSGYDMLPSDITLVGCWAHARRKFDEALKVLPVEKRASPSVAKEGLEYCNRLFDIEREYVNAAPELRYRVRQEKSRPVLDEFRRWLERKTPEVLPQSLLGQAVRYCLNQWDKLQRFLLDGRLELDNNRSERSIKPFVIGRKNWLFSNTPKGARASAIIYSIVETAKENGLIPFEYLRLLFERLPNLGEKDIDEILPWSDSIPAACRSPRQNT